MNLNQFSKEFLINIYQFFEIKYDQSVFHRRINFLILLSAFYTLHRCHHIDAIYIYCAPHQSAKASHFECGRMVAI